MFFPCTQDKKAPTGEDGEEKFDPAGYDKDLVENLERDIVQRNPNIHWYETMKDNLFQTSLKCVVCQGLYWKCFVLTLE